MRGLKCAVKYLWVFLFLSQSLKPDTSNSILQATLDLVEPYSTWELSVKKLKKVIRRPHGSYLQGAPPNKNEHEICMPYWFK